MTKPFFSPNIVPVVLSIALKSNTFFTAFIVKHDVSLEPSEASVSDIFEALQEYVRSWHLDCIYVEKRIQYLVYFVYGTSQPSVSLIQSIGEFLNNRHAALGRHFLAAGDTVSGLSKAYQSYASAVVLLQSSFFFPENSFLTSAILEDSRQRPEGLVSSPELVLQSALTNKDHDAAVRLLSELKNYFSKNHTLLPNQVRDLYYKLFLTLDDARKQLKLTESASSAREMIVDTLDHCFTFDRLHQVLVEKTETFFQDADSSSEENPTIFLIKDYISKHYMQETLSVKDISAHVFLSTSYVCTFFKNETGQTLNQYITEYRMERAKQLLGDSRYKIADISSKVGYSDGNYFGKSFQ